MSTETRYHCDVEGCENVRPWSSDYALGWGKYLDSVGTPYDICPDHCPVQITVMEVIGR